MTQLKRLNTRDLLLELTGKNRDFIRRVAKQQETKYGNKDIFGAEVYCPNAGYESNIITIWFGDYSIAFYFSGRELIDTLGNGQGHKYHKNLESCAQELVNIYSE